MEKIERVEILRVQGDEKRMQEIVNDCLVRGARVGEVLSGLEFTVVTQVFGGDVAYFVAKYSKENTILKEESKDGQAELIEQLKKIKGEIEKIGAEIKKVKSDSVKKEIKK